MMFLKHALYSQNQGPSDVSQQSNANVNKYKYEWKKIRPRPNNDVKIFAALIC
jgi:hypothetical protein